MQSCMATSTSCSLFISVLLACCFLLVPLSHARLLADKNTLIGSKAFSIKGGIGGGGGQGFGVSISHGGHDTSIGIGGGFGGGAGTTRGGGASVGGGAGAGVGIDVGHGGVDVGIGGGGGAAANGGGVHVGGGGGGGVGVHIGRGGSPMDTVYTGEYVFETKRLNDYLVTEILKNENGNGKVIRKWPQKRSQIVKVEGVACHLNARQPWEHVLLAMRRSLAEPNQDRRATSQLIPGALLRHHRAPLYHTVALRDGNVARDLKPIGFLLY
uniref:Uncharacterized protein n=1 Tax=Oryza brachyantha TaxID=4533 RepID=J3LQ87_ORYBR